MYNYLIKKPKRSWQNLSHEFKFDTGFGTLTPILCEEILPHDTIRLSTEMFTRFTALIAPAFQRCDARIEYFFVPNRIIWEDWEKFISNDQASQASVIKPYFALDSIVDKMVSNSLFDYLGYPVKWTDDSQEEHIPYFSSGKVDALPLRAYYKIWYDYYRDENVMTADGEPRTNGGSLSLASEPIWYLQSRCYPRDYFTSALPFAQQGANPVTLPLHYTNAKTTMTAAASQGSPVIENYVLKNSAGGSNAQFSLNNISNIVQGPTIEEMRRSSAVQRWLEKNIRFGSRYVEQIASHFGIHVGDYRLDRPEYLGGGKMNVRISEVLQQSESTQNSPLGDEAGHAIANGFSGIRKPYTAQEHGWLIGLLSFVPKASYGQGLPRKFNRWEVTDYAFPEFDNLGEQPLYAEELYAYSYQEDNPVFGYKPRYDEYKHSYDRYAGQFRESLSYWHLGRIFKVRPTLSANFIGVNYDAVPAQTDPDRLTRMFATDDTRNILCNIYNHLNIKRALSKGDVSFIK